jgi:hypothetical protein
MGAPSSVQPTLFGINKPNVLSHRWFLFGAGFTRSAACPVSDNPDFRMKIYLTCYVYGPNDVKAVWGVGFEAARTKLYRGFGYQAAKGLFRTGICTVTRSYGN